ncbi:MAG: RidA family protein [Anaerolineales bacterium]|nr:RidA family protein [Anaerolineales bacterium]MCA9927739.1 RidA family protein [Anaerolineales bacterium]
MAKEIIHTNHAPAAVGPYSQGVIAGNLLFTAGQVPLDPATGKLVEGDIAAQTEQVMKNLQAVLAEAGTSFDNVVKSTVFLADINDFAAMNGVYGRYVGENPPARSAFQVAALPLGARVEIEMVALVE